MSTPEPVHERGGTPPYAGNEPTRGPKHMAEPADQGADYARGGRHMGHGSKIHHPDGSMEEHHAHGGSSIHHADGTMIHHHAHGGHTVHHADGAMEHHHVDGRVIHHHAHGGHSIHHPHGMVEHHHAHGGRTIHHPDGHVEHHDGSEYAHGGHHMTHGDAAEDKPLIDREVRRGISQHESHEHHGEHTDLHLARGGMTRLPRGMRPAAERSRSPIGGAPPKRLAQMPTHRNQNDGTGIGYGVEPSAEPDLAGSDQSGMGGALSGGMRRGGHHRG